MSYTLTVYSKPRCQQCVAVKRSLTAKGITFTEGDAIAEVDMLREKGYQQAPVTFFDGYGQHIEFSGFDVNQIDRIYALITEADQEEP